MLIAIYAECYIQALMLTVLMLNIFIIRAFMLNVVATFEYFNFFVTYNESNKVERLSLANISIRMLSNTLAVGPLCKLRIIRSVVNTDPVADPIKNKWKFIHFCKLDGFSAVEFFYLIMKWSSFQ